LALAACEIDGTQTNANEIPWRENAELMEFLKSL
jgi:hypothetical protein